MKVPATTLTRRFIWMFLFIYGAFLFLDFASDFAERKGLISPAQKQKYLKDAGKPTIKHVRIDGVDYDIPVAYHIFVPGYINVPGVLLWGLYPEFDIPTYTPSQAFHSDRRYDSVQVNVRSDKYYPSRTQKFFEHHLKNSPYVETDKMQYGLITFEPKDGVYTERDELFIYRDKKEDLQTYIQCGVPKKGSVSKVSLCNHYYTQGNLHYNFGYHREQLPHWKEIQDIWVKKFEDFRTTAEQNKKEEVFVRPDQVDPWLLQLSDGK